MEKHFNILTFRGDRGVFLLKGFGVNVDDFRAEPAGDFAWPGVDFFAETQKAFIARQIRPSVTRPLIKINPVEGAGLSKSQGLGQLSILLCSFADAASEQRSGRGFVWAGTKYLCFVILFFFLISS